MKYIISLNFFLILLAACKLSSNGEKNKWIIELEHLSENLEGVSFESNNKCECTVIDGIVASEVIDTLESKFNLKDVIKINKSYDAIIRLEFKTYKNINEKFVWREYLTEDDKRNNSNFKNDKVVFFIQDEELYSSFLYNIQQAAIQCGAKLNE